MLKDITAPSICEKKNLLVVGPYPGEDIVGGVVQHMRVLRKIPALKTASFYDPGSLNGGTASIWQLISNCYGLRKVIKTNEIRQVWINSSIYTSSFIKTLIILYTLQCYQDVKVRVFFHGGRFQKIKILRLWPVKFFVQNILKKIDCFHFLSQDQGAGFSAIFPHLKRERFSNYLPTNTLLEKKTNKKTLLFVGRLVREKGVFDIIEAFNTLYNKKGMSDVVLWFAGDGPEMDGLQVLANKYAPDNVKMWGSLTNAELEKLYQQASVLLLPSYHEGFPYVIIEAMRSGLPIIASSTGAITDLIKDQKNGFIVPIKDPELLSNYINKLIYDEKLCEEISKENSKFFMENLSLNAAEKYYNKLRLGI